MHVDETKVNNATFARYLKQGAGYVVGMFGKYVGVVPERLLEHVLEQNFNSDP